MVRSSKVSVLGRGWKIGTDPRDRGREEEWFGRYPDEPADDAPVPGIIQQVFPEYHGVAWYWNRFAPEIAPGAGETMVLHFEAVDYYAQVWLNGEYLGEHEGAETPFDLDLAGALRQGTDNLLAVRVVNPAHEPIDGFVLREIPHSCKYVPYRVGGTQNHGGIVLPVELRALPAVRISEVFARPDIHTGAVRLEIALRNDASSASRCRLAASVAGASSGGTISEPLVMQALDLAPGETMTTLELRVALPRLWSPEDPYLYTVTVTLDGTGDGVGEVRHVHTLRCGFRELRVGDDGYFRLNGRRIFLKSSHTVNNFPIGLRLVAPDADMLRRDLLYARAAGFNMIRFIAGMAHPEQLSYCDEIGLMVYEETYAGWQLEDSPHMAERFDSSVAGMIRRDRNHPSVTIWGLMNEVPDNPVSRHAMTMLPMVRALDDSRLVLLSSGRWDGHLNVGSVSNPGTVEWQCLWGDEAPGEPAPEQPARGGFYNGIGDPVYYHGAGDTHIYPSVPHDPGAIHFLRTLGRDTKPVFLSEYGIGSMVDAIRLTRLYGQQGARADLEDAALYRKMAESFVRDWSLYGMDGVYPFPEDMLRDSQRLHSRQRIVGLDAIRSNPHICGYNLTGTVDQVMAGEGLWTTWRELKPGTMDALVDGFASLRWCLFVEPLHGYTGRPIRVEAVLANEDVLGPGSYPVWLRIRGPAGVVWERSVELSVPAAEGQALPALALPVLSEEVAIDGPAGEYCFAATMETGGAPAGGRLTFRLADPSALPRVDAAVTLLGVEDRVGTWLEGRGVRCSRFEADTPAPPGVILVGNPSDALDLAGWREVARRIAAGSAAVFLDPGTFRHGDDPTRWLPLAEKGRCYEFNNWLYHREDVARWHPLFDGLQAPGILDWDYYEQVIPRHVFEGQDTPDDVAAAFFAVGCAGAPDGYASGIIACSYGLGSGRFVLSTLRILENVDVSPVADRLLLNAIGYAATLVRETGADPPESVESILASVGYAEP